MPQALFNHAVEKLRALQSAPAAACKICSGEAHPFDIVDFNKICDYSLYPMGLSGIPVFYRQCGQCQFIFTDFFDTFSGEQWRQYVYNDDYAKVDPQYLSVRPRLNARWIDAALSHRKDRTIGLDYGGGNGATVARLRANGWAFDSFDPFAHTDMTPDRIGRYNFCSAIEVFEHSPDPIGSLRAILEKASPGQLIVMISTTLNDSVVSAQTRLSWWYAAPRNGHVSLYSRKSFHLLGAAFGLSCVVAGPGSVLLARGFEDGELSRLLFRGKVVRRLRTALHLWRGALA